MSEAASEILSTSDGIALAKAFVQLGDVEVRRSIVKLVKEIADDDEARI